MDQEVEVTNTAPASETPTTTSTTEAPTAQSGAEPIQVEKPDPKDRTAVIKAAAREASAKREAATNAAGRKIDPASGRYVKADGSLGEKAPGQQQGPSVAAPAAPATQTTTAAQLAALNAPGSLKAALKAQWGALPREWQEELVRIDSAAGKAAQPFQEKVKQLDEIMGVVSPYLPMIQAEGGTPARAIASLLQTAALLRTGTPQQKQFLFQQMARQYGVQLSAGEAQQGAQGEQPALPDIQAHPQFQQLAQTVNQLQGHLTQQQKAEQERTERANAEAVGSFLGEVDVKGQPKFPLDDSLQADFATQISIVRSQNPTWDARRVLEKAYDNLSWTSESLRELRLKKQAEERQAKEQQDLAAKRAAMTVKGSGPAAPLSTSIDVKDRHAVIRSAFAGIRK